MKCKLCNKENSTSQTHKKAGVASLSAAHLLLCTLSAVFQSVSSLDVFFRCACIKLLYIDIKVIASYRIAYKKIC